ncbi:hypothetical protein C8F01DRAFT_101388 [Mycena amicta]|nr:hypothetical protein C8F01DRAFT_101388 [Mycena amicta]
MVAASSDLQLITVRAPSPAARPAAKTESRAFIRRDEAGAPGKTLGRLYSLISVKVGSLVNGVARRRGLGPGAAAEVILDFFSHARWTEESVQELHLQKQIPTQVLAACSRLIKFAFRSQTPKTQYATFQKLVVLSTQFPGLKAIFEESDHISSAIQPPTTRHSQNHLFRLWDRPDDSACDSQWHFFCELAAACITDQAIFALIEGRPPAAVSSAVAHVSGLSFIEHLLHASAYDPKAPFFSHLSIRYLASIRNLKHFWHYLHEELPLKDSPERSQLYSGIVDKLLRRGELLLQDLGVDQSGEEKTVTMKPLSLDEKGVDAYCEALLMGLQTSFLQPLPVHASILTELWYHNLGSVIRLLRQQESEILLPKSRGIALNDTCAKYLAFHMEEQEVDVESDGGCSPTLPTSRPYDATDDHASIDSFVEEGHPNRGISNSSSRASSILEGIPSVPPSPISPTPSTSTSTFSHQSQSPDSQTSTSTPQSKSPRNQDESDRLGSTAEPLPGLATVTVEGSGLQGTLRPAMSISSSVGLKEELDDEYKESKEAGSGNISNDSDSDASVVNPKNTGTTKTPAVAVMQNATANVSAAQSTSTSAASSLTLPHGQQVPNPPPARKSRPASLFNRRLNRDASPLPRSPASTSTSVASSLTLPHGQQVPNPPLARKSRPESLFNRRLNASADNISLGSTVSSASVMIRNLGSMGQLARRNGLAGISALFKDRKGKNEDGKEMGEGEGAGGSQL